MFVLVFNNVKVCILKLDSYYFINLRTPTVNILQKYLSSLYTILVINCQLPKANIQYTVTKNQNIKSIDALNLFEICSMAHLGRFLFHIQIDYLVKNQC